MEISNIVDKITLLDPIKGIDIGEVKLNVQLEGSAALCKLIELIESHPRSNYEYFLITKAQTIPKLIYNLDSHSDELKFYSVALLLYLIKKRVRMTLSKATILQLTKKMGVLLNSPKSTLRLYALKVIKDLYKAEPHALADFPNVLRTVFNILCYFNDPEMMCRALNYFVLLVVDDESEPVKICFDILKADDFMNTLEAIEKSYHSMYMQKRYAFYLAKFNSIFTFLRKLFKK